MTGPAPVYARFFLTGYDSSDILQVLVRSTDDLAVAYDRCQAWSDTYSISGISYTDVTFISLEARIIFRANNVLVEHWDFGLATLRSSGVRSLFGTPPYDVPWSLSIPGAHLLAETDSVCPSWRNRQNFTDDRVKYPAWRIPSTTGGAQITLDGTTQAYTLVGGDLPEFQGSVDLGYVAGGSGYWNPGDSGDGYEH